MVAWKSGERIEFSRDGSFAYAAGDAVAHTTCIIVTVSLCRVTGNNTTIREKFNQLKGRYTDREREAVRQQYDNRYYDDVRHNDDNSYSHKKRPAELSGGLFNSYLFLQMLLLTVRRNPDSQSARTALSFPLTDSPGRAMSFRAIYLWWLLRRRVHALHAQHERNSRVVICISLLRRAFFFVCFQT
jgi:hypothetical protein